MSVFFEPLDSVLIPFSLLRILQNISKDSVGTTVALELVGA